MSDLLARLKDLTATITGRRNSGTRCPSDCPIQSTELTQRIVAAQMAEIAGKVNQHGGGMSIDR